MVLLLFIFFLFHYFFGQLIEIYKLKPLAIIMGLLILGLTYYFLLWLEYTADYSMYQYMFKHETDNTDFLFQFLTKFYKANHWSFHDLHVSHIVVSTLIVFYLISRFTSNVFYVFFAYIILDYVHFSNQIRYFLGFPVMILAFYNLFNKRYILFAILAYLAYLSHASLIVLLTFVPIYYLVKPKQYFKVLSILSVVCFIIVYVAFTLGLGLEIEHFGEYFKEEGTSSFLGGAFNAIPYIVMISFLYFESRKYINANPDCFQDPKFNFLYKISFYTIIFIPASFFMQIAGHRYVMPFMIFYVIFYLYLIRNKTQKIKNLKMILFSSVCFLLSLVIYILPDFLFGENHFLTEIDYMLKSIQYINYREW